jgi:tetratricopeptide (TPR) repeat protein
MKYIVRLKITFLFIVIAFCACSQNEMKHTTNPEAIRLNKQITRLIPYTDNADSCIKALSYLDSATSIDSSWFLCYYNKLMFLASPKKFKNAIIAINECIRIKPNAHDLYLMGGMLYRKVKDTVNSKEYFQKSLTICNNVLDTMSKNNRNYEMLTGNKAIDLIMLGDEKSGNEVFKNLYESLPDDKQFGTAAREAISSWMNKNQDQIMEIFLGSDNSLSNQDIRLKAGN